MQAHFSLIAGESLLKSLRKDEFGLHQHIEIGLRLGRMDERPEKGKICKEIPL